LLVFMLRSPPSPTLFPYTTLFRSFHVDAGIFFRIVAANDSSGAEAGSGKSCSRIETHATIGGHRSNRGPANNLVILSQSDRNSRSEEHTSELQSRGHLVCRLLLEK